MGLKNYSTKIPANKTISEIEESLLQHGATDLWKSYGANKEILSLAFAVPTEHGKIPFKLIINIEAVRQIIREQHQKGDARAISNAQAQDIEQARNVGWRILKDWIDAQMALVEVKMRKIEQVFLADIWDSHTEKTFFEVLEDKNFPGLLMVGKT